MTQTSSHNARHFSRTLQQIENFKQTRLSESLGPYLNGLFILENVFVSFLSVSSLQVRQQVEAPVKKQSVCVKKEKKLSNKIEVGIPAHVGLVAICDQPHIVTLTMN